MKVTCAPVISSGSGLRISRLRNQGADRLAVVDGVAEVGERRQHPGDDPDREQREHDHVDAGRRHPDPREADPPVDEHHEADA